MYVLVFGLAGARLVEAQDSERIPDDVAFASYVPATAPGFLSARSLAEVDSVLGEVKAGQLISWLTGTTNERAQQADWQAVMRQFLGPNTPIDVSRLMQGEAAIAFDSWHDLSHMVWFFRLREARLLDTWFPEAMRTAEDRSRSALMFRTADGLIVALRGDVLVLARRWVGDRLLIDIIQMLTGRPDASLGQSLGYRELTTYLPPNALACMYFGENLANGRLSPLESMIGAPAKRVVLGVYGEKNRIDLAIRGTLASAVAQASMNPQAIVQVMRLPRTTLFAFAQARTMDPQALAGKGNNELSRLVRLLLRRTRLRAPDNAGADAFGPHVVVAWGQSISGERDFPQLAALVECADATALKEEVDGVLTNVLVALRGLDKEKLASLGVVHETYLGVPLSFIPRVAIDNPSKLGALRLLTDIQPAWAAWGDWMIVATHRNHLERILDAQFGLVPTLGSAPAAGFVRPGQRGITILSVAQAADAALQIDSWLDDAAESTPSWLDPLWWDSVLGTDLLRGASLGLEIAPGHAPGALAVRAIVADTAAAGRLRPGDRIIGLNGRTLDFDEPARDFRHQWRQRPRESNPRLRVLRQGKLLDVELVIMGNAEDERPEFDPAPWLRRVATLGRSISFGNLTVHPTDEQHYSARITLHRSGEAATP